ncbi:MAG: TolC family protein [Bacteroidales bacterium]|nr:TolC family protein [Bacteroidales bacterium]
MVTRREFLIGTVALWAAGGCHSLESHAELPGRPPPEPPENENPNGPLTLNSAFARSLANVEVVQANVSIRIANVGRFEALKSFIPMTNLPQLFAGFNQFGGAGDRIIFPDVTDGAPLAARPGLNYASLNRLNMFFPLDPAGQIAALPLAEEGIRIKELMEQMVRRSQAVLGAQRYFEAKQIPYGLQTAELGVEYAHDFLGVVKNRFEEKQAFDLEVSQARVDVGKAEVLEANLEKEYDVRRQQLGVVLHTSRLLVSQEEGPLPIQADFQYVFDLRDPDTVDLSLIPDFPQSREEAVQRAKQQRFDVRMMEAGLRAARIQDQRDLLALLGLGKTPIGLGFKNAGANNGGIALGAVFGMDYDVPLIDIGLWADLRKSRLEVVRTQLELEKVLIEAGAEAGDAWDRWQYAEKDWRQREDEYRLQQEALERKEHLFEEKQVIEVEVLAAKVALSQANTNRWTSWYNLQLARLDILRSIELLLDYIEKARSAPRTGPSPLAPPPPTAGYRHVSKTITDKAARPPEEPAKPVAQRQEVTP